MSTYAWMGDAVGTPIIAYQRRGDGTYNTIGKLGNLTSTASNKYWDLIFKIQN